MILRYLGLDAASKLTRQKARDDLAQAEAQLQQLRSRLEETSKISVTGNSALKTLSERDYGGRRRRTAG